MRVLIVDAEQAFAEPLAQRLELRGSEAAVAGDAETALGMLSRQEWDLVFLDVCLPGMDGVSLRKNNLTGPIALVLGSAGSGVSQLVKKLCDGVVRLDMAAPGTGVVSYNVSVAAGIILYEIQSQRAVEE